MSNEAQLATWINALQRDVADLKRIAQKRRSSVAFSAAGGGGTTSGTTELGATALVVPDQGCAGTLLVLLNLYVSKSVSTDVFYGFLRNGAAVTGALVAQSRHDYGAATVAHFVTHCEVSMVAGSPVTISSSVQRAAGSGTASFSADATLQRIDAIFVPT